MTRSAAAYPEGKLTCRLHSCLSELFIPFPDPNPEIASKVKKIKHILLHTVEEVQKDTIQDCERETVYRNLHASPRLYNSRLQRTGKSINLTHDLYLNTLEQAKYENVLFMVINSSEGESEAIYVKHKSVSA